MDLIQKTRAVDPFFENAINQVFLQPEKTAFIMDGPIGTGKSSNFVMQGAYNISQSVTPIKKRNRMVRESKWAAVRESENSALATILQLIGEAIFTPDIMALENSPVQVNGSHPAKVTVKHELPDGTFLEMHIECHGFNNEAAHNRLRTHEFLGALIFEMQGIPFNIFEVVTERCGRFRTSDLTISKKIKGVTHTLSGITKLAIVLCDVNIPERPHPLYKEYYDKVDKASLPYLFLTPPSPLIFKPVDSVTQDVLDKYPVTKFEGNDVVWIPNPKVYNMTRHFEERDDKGNNIPWTGYKYWFNRLHRTDSHVRRYVLGVPDTVGGESAVYSNFKQDEHTISKHKLSVEKPVYVGFDPGGYAGIILMQKISNTHIHFFKEFVFEPVDRASTRTQFADFLLPWCRENLKGYRVIIVPDPAATSLGKNIITGQEESALNILMDEVRVESARNDCVTKYTVTPCLVANQNTEARVNALGFFIDKGYVTISKGCEMFIAAMSGQYKFKKLRSGIISSNIDKDNQPWADIAEAAQYPVVNILTDIKKGKNAKRQSGGGIRRVKRTR